MGPAVIFIHAGVSDRRMWDPQFRYFADRFQVVRYDLRGFGRSEMTDLSYSNRADLLRVLQFLRIEKAALVGCSMGGSAASVFDAPQTPLSAGMAGVHHETMATRTVAT